MANDVKRSNTARLSAGRGRPDEPGPSARITLLACLITLAAMLTQLPGPAEAWATLTDDRPLRSPGDPLAAVQTILLTTAGLLAWVLAGWAIIVLGIGVLTRLPGRSGRRARRLLPRIAPAAVGRLVLTAVGASLIAGTAACAAPGATPAGAADPSSWAASGPTSGSGAGFSTGSAADPSPDPSVRASGGADLPSGSFAIDWPDPTSLPDPASGPTGPVQSTADPTTLPTPLPSTVPTTVPAPVPTTAITAAAAEQTPVSATAAADLVATSGTASAGPAPEPSGAPAADTPPLDTPVLDTPVLDTPPVNAPGSDSPGSVAGPAASPASPEPSLRIVTVQPGDSLWRIAAHSLGPDATDADIDNAWRAWYFGNLDVIGDNPDRIVPGQSLVAPGGEQVQR